VNSLIGTTLKLHVDADVEQLFLDLQSHALCTLKFSGMRQVNRKRLSRPSRLVSACKPC
jgi:hypothetical protein